MKRLISLLLLVVATPLMGDTAKVGDYTWTYRINDDAAEIYNNNSANISPDSTGVVTMLSANPTFHVRLDGELFSRRNAA